MAVTTKSAEVAEVVPTEETAPATPALQANEVQLEDGTIIRLRKTNAFDDTEIDSIVFDWKANDMGVVPPTISLRAQALNAITHINGVEQQLISDRNGLIVRMRKFSSDDMDLIGDKYYEVQGKKKKMIEAIREAAQAMREGTTF